MSDAFSHGSKTSTFMKMLRTVPEHAFWDIKKPLMPEVDYHMNPYNPARQVPFSSFFDARKYTSTCSTENNNAMSTPTLPATDVIEAIKREKRILLNLCKYCLKYNNTEANKNH